MDYKRQCRFDFDWYDHADTQLKADLLKRKGGTILKISDQQRRKRGRRKGLWGLTRVWV